MGRCRYYQYWEMISGVTLKSVLILNGLHLFFEKENEEFMSFPELGRQCTLLTPWKGYDRATIVGLNGYRFVVQVSSGAELEVYPDEIEFD